MKNPFGAHPGFTLSAGEDSGNFLAPRGKFFNPCKKQNILSTKKLGKSQKLMEFSTYRKRWGVRGFIYLRGQFWKGSKISGALFRAKKKPNSAQTLGDPQDLEGGGVWLNPPSHPPWI